MFLQVVRRTSVVSLLSSCIEIEIVIIVIDVTYFNFHSRLTLANMVNQKEWD